MLLSESTGFNRGFPEPLELTFTEFNKGFPAPPELTLPIPAPAPPPPPPPPVQELTLSPPVQEFNLLSMEALEKHFWLLAGVLGFLLLVTALCWLKRKKTRTLELKPQVQTKNLPYKNEMSLMLTLAKQYNEAGYSDNALQLLNTVLAHGNEAEGDEAFQLITQIQKDIASNPHNVNHVF
jgi:FimV-like protein